MLPGLGGGCGAALTPGASRAIQLHIPLDSVLRALRVLRGETLFCLLGVFTTKGTKNTKGCSASGLHWTTKDTKSTKELNLEG